MTKRYDRMVEALLVEGLDDFLDLCWCNGVVREVGRFDVDYVTDAPNLREATLTAIKSVLAEGLMEIGDLTNDEGVVPWELSAEEAVARVRREWLALGRLPNLWEIGWLELTPKGKQIAMEIEARPSYIIDQTIDWLTVIEQPPNHADGPTPAWLVEIEQLLPKRSWAERIERFLDAVRASPQAERDDAATRLRAARTYPTLTEYVARAALLAKETGEGRYIERGLLAVALAYEATPDWREVTLEWQKLTSVAKRLGLDLVDLCEAAAAAPNGPGQGADRLRLFADRERRQSQG